MVSDDTGNGYSLSEARRRIEALESRFQSSITDKLFHAEIDPIRSGMTDLRAQQDKTEDKLDRLLWWVLGTLLLVTLQLAGTVWTYARIPI